MLTQEEASAFVASLYKALLGRCPEASQLDRWTKFLIDEQKSPEQLFYRLVNSKQYQQRAPCCFPPGHYYSPIVNPDDQVRAYLTKADNLAGLDVSLERMEKIWTRCASIIGGMQVREGARFSDQHMFPYGDATALRAMLWDLKPKRVIEVGSGFTSALMLDTADEFDLTTRFTFIDPHCSRLKRLLRPEDHARATIIETPVQKMELSEFSGLTRGDILFIDSTHVLKTGSDVHYELFHIMPVLQSGVTIHFHDIRYPFEYPRGWIFEMNRSWNEIYGLRAFLMYNTSFQISFWGSYFYRARRDLVEPVAPHAVERPGSSIWLERL